MQIQTIFYYYIHQPQCLQFLSVINSIKYRMFWPHVRPCCFQVSYTASEWTFLLFMLFSLLVYCATTKPAIDWPVKCRLLAYGLLNKNMVVMMPLTGAVVRILFSVNFWSLSPQYKQYNNIGVIFALVWHTNNVCLLTARVEKIARQLIHEFIQLEVDTIPRWHLPIWLMRRKTTKMILVKHKLGAVWTCDRTPVTMPIFAWDLTGRYSCKGIRS